MSAYTGKYLRLLILVNLLAVDVLWGGTSTRSIVAARTATPPRIDGILSEEAWHSAVPIEGFTQYDPEEGAAPTERTSVMMLYDDNAVYVGVHCYDSDPSGIRTVISRRDRSLQADKFTVMIDSYHDHQSAFLFSGTVSGVQSDGILSQDGLLYSGEWDAVWDFNAQIVADGWTAEFRIPYTALRFAIQDSEYVWGINFRRYIPRKLETDEWVMVPRAETQPGTISSVSKIGHLSGLRDIRPGLHLELLPYAVSQQSWLSKPEPHPLSSEFKGSAGLDAKYGISNNFTADLTINPDFGQVEVDQAVLNLTVFETFYPEKRPFFLEGSQLFSFGNVFDNRELLLLYSRRIGAKPSAQPDSGYEIVDEPQTTTILGAAKLSGKTDGGLTMAVLTAVTDKEEGTQVNAAGEGKTLLFEPLASYNAVRLKQNILENSSVGMMATGVFHDMGYPNLSGGVDWNLRFDQSAYAVDGYVAGSQNTTAPGDRLSGSAGRLGLGKLAGDHWLGFSFYEYSTKNFNVDNIGYYSQPREHGGYTQVTYKEDHADAPVRRYTLNAESDYAWNWDGVNTINQLQFYPAWEFRNFWSGTINYTHALRSYDDLSRGVAGLYYRPASDALTATIYTDIQQPFVFTVQGKYLTSAKGQKSASGYLNVTIRPNTWIELAPEVTILNTRGEEYWFIPYDPTFADRSIDQYSFALRGTMTFTRTISLQFFGQLFLAKGHYENFKLLAGPDELTPVVYAGNPDFNEKVINANVVFRWEYLPGSTFYFVWTQARSGATNIYDRSFGQNVSDALRLPMDNVLLAKVSYWWSM
jgi:hypothetical protein